MKKKNILLLIVVLMLVLSYNCLINNKKEILTYKQSTIRGLEFISFFSDSTYKYILLNYTDTIKHSGTWVQSGDTFVLNSYKRPDNYSLINVEETVVKNSDSVVIMISTDFLPKSFPVAAGIRVNGYDYQLQNRENNKLVLKNIKVNDIVICENWSDYPIYYSKNPLANYFEIQIHEIPIEDCFDQWSYLINEKFVEEDTLLYHLRNGKKVEWDIFTKSDLDWQTKYSE